MEDKRYLEVLDAIRMELEGNIVDFNRRANGSSEMSKEDSVAIRLEQNERLAEMLKKHRRHLLYILGKEVEAETHDSGQIHLLPVGGGMS
jgi:hypothetical protein